MGSEFTSNHQIQNESSKTCPEKLLKRSIHWCKLTKSKFHWKHAFFLRSWNCWSPLWASLRRNDWDICAELSEIAWAGLEGCGKKQMWKRTARKQKSCSEFCMMYDYKLWNVQTILWSSIQQEFCRAVVWYRSVKTCDSGREQLRYCSGSSQNRLSHVKFRFSVGKTISTFLFPTFGSLAKGHGGDLHLCHLVPPLWTAAFRCRACQLSNW